MDVNERVAVFDDGPVSLHKLSMVGIPIISSFDL